MLGALFVLCRLQAFLWFSDTQSQISEKILDEKDDFFPSFWYQIKGEAIPCRVLS